MRLRNAFAIDALDCERCGGRMLPLVFVTKPDEMRALLGRIHRERARAS